MARGTIPKKQGEEWRPIEGYEEFFVSNFGRIRKNKRLVKMSINKDGYYACWLGKKRALIHRLVSEAFIPNPENKKCIDHIDGDKTNNVVTNLRWVTTQENTQAAYDLGLIKRSEVVAINQDGEVALYKTQASAAKDLDLDAKAVNNVIKGLLNSVKGWTFYRMKSFIDKR